MSLFDESPATMAGKLIGRMGSLQEIDKSVRPIEVQPQKPLQEISDFNIGPMPPGDKIHLDQLQKQVFEFKAHNDQAFRQLLDKLEIHHPRIQDLTPDERKRIDQVNFQVVQSHMLALGDYWNETAPPEKLPFNYYDSAISEVLAKSLAYNSSIKNGDTILIPTKTDYKFELVEYHIHLPGAEKMPNLGEGLPYFFLTPTTKGQAKPWMVIRGTETLDTKDAVGHKETYLADLGFKDVSDLPAWASITPLVEMFAKEAKEYGPINIIGHSLGATLAQTVGVLCHPYCESCMTFGNPGVDEIIYDLYKQNLTHVEKAKFTTFQRQGDIVASASSHVIGRQFEVQFTGHEGFHRLSYHSDLLLARPFIAKTIDVAKENKNLIRKIINWSRYNILSKLSFISHRVLWWHKRKTYETFEIAYLNWIMKLNRKEAKKQHSEKLDHILQGTDVGE